MSPITNRGTDWRTQAKQGGWKQVRESLQEFEGTVVKADFGQWSAEKEFLEIESAENVILKKTEDLDMDIAEKFNFRVNCSEGATSFWVADFLEAADKLKLLIPEDLRGKRLRWAKVKKEYNIGGQVVNTENFVPVAIVQGGSTQRPITQGQEVSPSSGEDLMNEMLEMAVGKTERQFRTAISLSPKFAGSPFLAMAKMGAITDSFVKNGQLVLDGEVYKKA